MDRSGDRVNPLARARQASKRRTLASVGRLQNMESGATSGTMTPGEPALDQILPGRLNKDGIRIHSAADFAGMRAAGTLAADILDRIATTVVPA